MSDSRLGRVETVLARLLNRRLRDVLTPMDLTPVQVTVIYAFLGFAALYFSDVYLPRSIPDPAYLQQVQALKGGVEVVLTAGLIFLMTYRSRQSLERQNEQLNALQGERSVLHRVFRHNLRQDINVILGCNDLIESQFDDDRVREPCQQVLERVAKIERYQDKLRRFERLLEPPIPLHVTDLTAVVLESPQMARLQRSDAVSVALDLPDESPVLTTTHVTQAFHEILENAVIHNDADAPEIAVSVGAASDGLVDLVVTDNGSGIPPYERRAINQLEEQQLTHSSGLGLWMAKLACTVSGGELVIPPQADGGTVVLRLPAAAHRTAYRRLTGMLRSR